jgi:hypothetical protein
MGSSTASFSGGTGFESRLRDIFSLHICSYSTLFLTSCLLVLLFDPEERGITFLRSVSKYSTRLHYITLQKILLSAVPAFSVIETKFERLGPAVALCARIWEGSVRNSIGTPAISTKISVVFPSPFRYMYGRKAPRSV